MKEPAAVATCLCGAIRIEVARKPRTLTQCNCSVCRRYGTLWAYYTRKDIAIAAPRGGRDMFSVRPRGLRFMRCATCGCITNWEMPAKTYPRVGINARLMDPAVIAQVPISILDGDKTWKRLGRYVRPEIFVSPHHGTVTPARARARSR